MRIKRKMRFRPCIDIHNGKVKQIIGGSLRDQKDAAAENFVAEKDAGYYAELYREKGIKGGHVIMLNPPSSEYYKATREQALKALRAYPEGFQAGGGITPANAEEFLKAGASHVIVTSYVFQKGKFHRDRLREMLAATGKERLVLDLSCRKKGESYYIVTDRWQNDTDIRIDRELLQELARYCAEFLVHGVDVEGRAEGIEEELSELLGRECTIPVTYAGGVHNMEDLMKLKKLGNGKVDVTIGSALDLFGGSMKLEEVLSFIGQGENFQ